MGFEDISLSGLGAGQIAAQGGRDLINYGLYRLDRDANWRREDTAVQRRMSNLRAAGINPILAAGQEASAGAQTFDGAKGEMSLGELIQLRAANKQMAHTEAETNLLTVQAEKEEVAKEGLSIANDHAKINNPLIEEANRKGHRAADDSHNAAALQLDFDRQMNPVRYVKAQRESTGQQISNEKSFLEKQLVDRHIDSKDLEIAMSGLKLEIMRKFGMADAEADNYLKRAAIWIADNDAARRAWDDAYVAGTGGSFNVSSGSGMVGQLRQMLGMAAAPVVASQQKRTMVSRRERGVHK